MSAHTNDVRTVLMYMYIKSSTSILCYAEIVFASNIMKNLINNLSNITFT